MSSVAEIFEIPRITWHHPWKFWCWRKFYLWYNYKSSAIRRYTQVGRRGAPAKGVGRETGARVQISLSPPQKNRNFDISCGFYICLHKNFQGFTYCSVFKVLVVVLSGNSGILSQLLLFVNNFFQLFSKFFFKIFNQSLAEKEGFEPSRRFPDLHP